jgi:general secretion pathway protein H
MPLQNSFSRRGATLLEILITLGLMGMLAGVIVVGSAAMLRDRPATAEDVLRAALSKARRYAVETLREVRFSYDAKAKAFTASTIDGVRSFPVDYPGELKIEFMPAKQTGAMLLGGEAVETGGLKFITFFPDGACSPFRVQIRTGGPARIVAYDPWTCAPMLEAKP